MQELVEFREPYARVVVHRDGDDLVFWSDTDDNGRSIVDTTRIPLGDYVAKGEGPWPWYDLGYRRDGARRVLEALGVAPQPWTEPLPPEVLALFDTARAGWASIADRLTAGLEPDALDACGATPLWYAVRALDHAAALVLIDAGADPTRRIELSARGERFTTILHETVRCGRTVALNRALARGADPSPLDSDGATPMHALDDRSDHLNPELVRALVAAGADVDAVTAGGLRPIDVAAQRVLPSTVATLLDLGAEPAKALTALLIWWAANVRWAAYRRGDVVRVVDLLRAGGAVVAPGDRELATEAGVSEVVAALDA
ncbi:ankyrin repeat domain-containing protein [Mycolicibacterium sp.]|uniref:ankyrin repeat domain-containing protein n=1 Tax=Mycolicibacterium sp. TaxID=2320850 RepID=UPI001A1AAD63|nr:ankyrin repeat domain-containing protein [Mycolicibacterium sp.]MBJ7336905.1 ankyrin repeat domain-containing protein [Mycolicibacterium sp.]